MAVGMVQRTWRWVACAAALGVAHLFPAAACAGALTIAAEDDWAPYSYRVEGASEVQGLAPELVRAAFATQGVSVQFDVLPFSRCLLHAERGKAAGCFNVTRTQSNASQFCWHPTPLFTEELGIFGAHPAGPRGPWRSRILSANVWASRWATPTRRRS